MKRSGRLVHSDSFCEFSLPLLSFAELTDHAASARFQTAASLRFPDREPPGEAEGEALGKPLESGNAVILSDLSPHKNVFAGVKTKENQKG